MGQQDDQVARSWNQWTDQYVDMTGTEGNFYDKYLVIPSMLRLLGEVDGLRVLDLGCGTGVFAREIARRGATVFGMDLTEKMLAKAVELEQAEPLGIDYRLGDASEVDEFEDASFDRVTCNMALMNVEHYAQAIGHAYRVLKPGGRLAFSIYHPCFSTPESGWVKNPGAGDENQPARFWRVDYYFDRRPSDAWFHRTLGDYVKAVLSAGFTIEAIDEPEPWPELIARQPDSIRTAGWLVFLAVKP